MTLLVAPVLTGCVTLSGGSDETGGPTASPSAPRPARPPGEESPAPEGAATPLPGGLSGHRPPAPQPPPPEAAAPPPPAARRTAEGEQEKSGSAAQRAGRAPGWEVSAAPTGEKPDTGICDLGERYGRWQHGSEEAQACRQVYGN